MPSCQGTSTHICRGLPCAARLSERSWCHVRMTQPEWPLCGSVSNMSGWSYPVAKSSDHFLTGTFLVKSIMQVPGMHVSPCVPRRIQYKKRSKESGSTCFENTGWTHDFFHPSWSQTRNVALCGHLFLQMWKWILRGVK